MTQRPKRMSWAALSGGGLTMAGTFLPWTYDPLRTPMVAHRGLESTLGVLLCIVGLAIMVIALTPVAGRRLILMVLGLTGAFWLLVAYQRTSGQPTPSLTIGPGWYLSWIGVGITLVVSLVLPLWYSFRTHRAPQ